MFGSRQDLHVCRSGSSLIATFGRANPPLVWRFDLERNHSFALAMQGQDGEWELGVTSVKGEFHSIARFPVREDAEDAFAEVSAVLSKGRFGSLVGFLKGVALVVFLFVTAALATQVILHVMRVVRAPAPLVQGQVAAPILPSAPATAANEPLSDGIPLPADEALKPPSP